MTPREIIRAEYGSSRNIITPRRLGVGALPGGAYELSRGNGIGGGPIYGVSVVRVNTDGATTMRDTNASALFGSSREAHSYINRLKRAS